MSKHFSSKSCSMSFNVSSPNNDAQVQKSTMVCDCSGGERYDCRRQSAGSGLKKERWLKFLCAFPSAPVVVEVFVLDIIVDGARVSKFLSASRAPILFRLLMEIIT